MDTVDTIRFIIDNFLPLGINSKNELLVETTLKFILYKFTFDKSVSFKYFWFSYNLSNYLHIIFF